MKPDRPKRKATANKSYIESIDETLKQDLDYFSEESNAAPVGNQGTPSRSSPSKNGLASPSSAKRSTINGPSIPYNWQALPRSQDYFSQRLDLTDAYIDLVQQAFYCPNQISNLGDSQKKRPGKLKVQKGDYIYMVSEPPGEPYYIGRVMGFKAKGNIPESNIGDAKDYMLKIQWFYRPRDVSRGTSDSRLLFASMHSDTCPIGSFRGLVTVKHKYDIEQEYIAKQAALERQQSKKGGSKLKAKSALASQSPTYLEEYLEQINCFYFDKLFDRYMIKFYDVLPTSQLLQYSYMDDCRSRNFLVALHKRFEFIFVEPHQTKVLLKTFSSKACNCEKCGQWCASVQDSINCLLCQKHYHMMCLDPPLTRKPSRGFSWSCAQCTKKHDLELQSNSSLMLSNDNKSSNASELASKEKALKLDIEQEIGNLDEDNGLSQDTDLRSRSASTDLDREGSGVVDTALPKYEIKAQEFLHSDNAITLEQRRLREEWSMRYLGLHARLEDGVDLEDRSPYPRASTRLGAKNQAINLPEYNGHPIVYYDPQPSKIRKNAASASSKKTTGSKSEINCTLLVPKKFTDVPVLEYPDWLQPRPKGYIERGIDDGPHCTSTLLWKPMESDIADSFKTLDSYMTAVEPIAKAIGVTSKTPNFVDAALYEYLKSNGDTKNATRALSSWTKKALKEPTFNREEVKRFEKGVQEFGSELHQVQRVVKSQPKSMVVRFYYVWKKTELGKRIWGNFEGRAQKKLHKANKEEPLKVEKLLDASIGGDDDSSYDYEKTVEARISFECKFCHTRRSIQWFRVTGHEANEPDNESNDCVALCFRCAKLWRRYAVSWEDALLLEKSSKSHGWRRKIEFELSQDAQQLRREAEHRHAYIDYDYKEPPKVFSPIIPLKRAVHENPLTQALSFASKATQKRFEKTVDVACSETSLGSPKVEPIKKESGSRQTVKKETAEKNIIKEDIVKRPIIKKPTTKKQAVKKETAPKNLVAKKATKKAKIDASGLVGSNASTNDSKPESAPRNSKKRKIESESLDATQSIQNLHELKKPSSRGGTQKRQKKAFKNQAALPFLNQNYEIPHYAPRLDPKDPSIALINQKELKIIVDEYRVRLILNNVMQIQALPLPHTQPCPESIHMPFCAVCRDPFNTTLPLEAIRCTECNVSVHCVCAGIPISNKMPSFVCDACANKVYLLQSACRLCVLCPSFHDDEHKDEPQLLLSIADTGRWCHLQCALFNYDLVEFSSRQKHKTSKVNSSKGFLPTLESVTKTLMTNVDASCKICDQQNGALVNCRYCDPGHKFHITCAQKAGNFTVGFTLAAISKDEKPIRVGDESGKLVPTIICPDHVQHNDSVHGFHHVGEREIKNRRTLGQLIELFLHNACSYYSVRNGKRTFISMRTERYGGLETDRMGEEYFEFNNSSRSQCSRCSSTVSPAWWVLDIDGRGGKMFDGTDCGLDRLCCHTCYKQSNEITGDDEIEMEVASLDFIESLNRPLSGTHYGIHNEHDHICAPLQISHSASDTPQSRGQISIRDILD